MGLGQFYHMKLAKIPEWQFRMRLQQDRNQKPQFWSETGLPLQGKVDLPPEVALWLVEHPWALKDYHIIGLFFNNVRNSLYPVVAALQALLIQPDSDPASLELFSKGFGARFITVFMTQKYYWGPGGRLGHGRLRLLGGNLPLVALTQLVREILPGKLVEVDEMAALEEKNGLPVVGKVKKAGVF